MKVEIFQRNKTFDKRFSVKGNRRQGTRCIQFSVFTTNQFSLLLLLLLLHIYTIIYTTIDYDYETMTGEGIDSQITVETNGRLAVR